jgi:hypothetical protein
MRATPACSCGAFGERERGEGVVGDGFEGVLLEQWNMLVGGGVEDELRRFEDSSR